MSLIDGQETADRDNRWHAILKASEALLISVQEDRWEELELQAQYRDKLIEEYFAEPVNVESALRVREDITNILTINEKILGYARRQREIAAGNIKQLQTGNRATQSYLNNAR